MLMELEFPGVSATVTSDAIILQSEQDLRVLASAVVGGGLTRTSCIINRHVSKDYDHPDPGSDLQSFAASRRIPEPFVGLMTAVYLHRAQAVTLRDDELTLAGVVTAGLSNPADSSAIHTAASALSTDSGSVC